MRHNKKFNHLGRKSAHRKAMLANMANSLILHKRISTTIAKAKALKMYFEPLVTKAKTDSTHSRRMVFSYLKSKTAVAELFREVAEKVGDRPGGYTRILKTGVRPGDSAEMCIIELVDFNENMLAAKESKTKSRRSRRGGSASAASASKKEEKPAAPAKKEKKAAPVAEEAVVVEPVVESAAEVESAEIVETPEVEEAPEVVEASAPAEEEAPKADDSAEGTKE